MRHVDLLGAELKCEFLCDLFETYDVEVAYKYDRAHEGMADEYTAVIPELGLQFVFGEHQTLRALFIELVEIGTYCPLDELKESFPLFRSKAEAQRFARETEATAVEGNVEFAGAVRDWIQFEHSGYSVHYEFHGSRLTMITLQAEDA